MPFYTIGGHHTLNFLLHLFANISTLDYKIFEGISVPRKKMPGSWRVLNNIEMYMVI